MTIYKQCLRRHILEAGRIALKAQSSKEAATAAARLLVRFPFTLHSKQLAKDVSARDPYADDAIIDWN